MDVEDGLGQEGGHGQLGKLLIGRPLGCCWDGFELVLNDLAS